LHYNKLLINGIQTYKKDWSSIYLMTLSLKFDESFIKIAFLLYQNYTIVLYRGLQDKL